MPKIWRIATHDPERVAALERSAGIPAVVAQLLLVPGDRLSAGRPRLSRSQAQRPARSGITARRGRGGRDTAPGDRRQKADHRLRRLRRRRHDGHRDSLGCLRLLGANADYYVPNRIDEGYGLNHEAMRSFALGRGPGCRDGRLRHRQRRRGRDGRRMWSDADRHRSSPGAPPWPFPGTGRGKSGLPRAAAIVHPGLPGGTYPFAGLCGAAVALKLAWALCQQASEAKRVSESMRNYLMRAVGLAAVGTIADVVPLVDENRVLVRHGLNCLRHWTVPGLKALEHVTGLDKKPALTLRRHCLHDRPAAQRRRPAGPGPTGHRTALDRIAAAGDAAGRVRPRAQRAAAIARTEHLQGGEQEVGQRRGRPRRTCRRSCWPTASGIRA